MTTATATSIRERVDALDWDALREQLDERGHAITVPLLERGETDELADLFDGGRFRSTIDMARHRFGDGRYRYFDHPLPEAIAELRGSFTATWRRSRTTGLRCCAATTRRSRSSTTSCSSAAGPPARSGPRR